MGVIPTVAPYLLPICLVRYAFVPAILCLNSSFARISARPLVDSLLAGELDVLLLALPFPAEQVETMPLFEDDFFLACLDSHPLATRSALKSADLKGESLFSWRRGIVCVITR